VKARCAVVLTMVKLSHMDRKYPKEITAICAHARLAAK